MPFGATRVFPLLSFCLGLARPGSQNRDPPRHQPCRPWWRRPTALVAVHCRCCRCCRRGWPLPLSFASVDRRHRCPLLPPPGIAADCCRYCCQPQPLPHTASAADAVNLYCCRLQPLTLNAPGRSGSPSPSAPRVCGPYRPCRRFGNAPQGLRKA